MEVLDWSLQQIPGWLKIQYPDDESMRVSHETIYRSLFIRFRGPFPDGDDLGDLTASVFKDARVPRAACAALRVAPADRLDGSSFTGMNRHGTRPES